jgi:predicted DNA-binding transcriptional regulator AlpA
MNDFPAHRAEQSPMSISNHRPPKRARRAERIYSLGEFAALNSISKACLLRAIALGDGPRVVKITSKRLGIRESDGAAWQAERAAHTPSIGPVNLAKLVAGKAA